MTPPNCSSPSPARRPPPPSSTRPRSRSTSGATGLTATDCVTVLPHDNATAPATGPGVCAAGAPTLTLDCTAVDRPLRRRLPRLGRLDAPGLVDAGRPLHHVPHLPGAERRRRHGRAPRRRRPPRDGCRRGDNGGHAHGPPRRSDDPGGRPPVGEPVGGGQAARPISVPSRSWPRSEATRRRIALRPHQPGCALRSRHLRRNRPADGAGRRRPAQRRSQARGRAVGGHQRRTLPG